MITRSSFLCDVGIPICWILSLSCCRPSFHFVSVVLWVVNVFNPEKWWRDVDEVLALSYMFIVALNESFIIIMMNYNVIANNIPQPPPTHLPTLHLLTPQLIVFGLWRWWYSATRYHITLLLLHAHCRLRISCVLCTWRRDFATTTPIQFALLHGIYSIFHQFCVA